jgi:hypothetical protein
MGMTFNLSVNHAAMILPDLPIKGGADISPKTNIILTVLVTAARRSGDFDLRRDFESIQGSATILNEDIATWLAERGITYILGKMDITIHDDDQAMEFKLRWL